jgi:hypothetical protein
VLDDAIIAATDYDAVLTVTDMPRNVDSNDINDKTLMGLLNSIQFKYTGDTDPSLEHVFQDGVQFRITKAKFQTLATYLTTLFTPAEDKVNYDNGSNQIEASHLTGLLADNTISIKMAPNSTTGGLDNSEYGCFADVQCGYVANAITGSPDGRLILGKEAAVVKEFSEQNFGVRFLCALFKIALPAVDGDSGLTNTLVLTDLATSLLQNDKLTGVGNETDTTHASIDGDYLVVQDSSALRSLLGSMFSNQPERFFTLVQNSEENWNDMPFLPNDAIAFVLHLDGAITFKMETTNSDDAKNAFDLMIQNAMVGTGDSSTFAKPISSGGSEVDPNNSTNTHTVVRATMRQQRYKVIFTLDTTLDDDTTEP